MAASGYQMPPLLFHDNALGQKLKNSFLMADYFESQ